MLEAGSLFANYRIVRRLGGDSLGSRYVVDNPDVAREEVLTVLSAERYGSEFLADFELWASTMETLDYGPLPAYFSHGIAANPEDSDLRIPWCTSEYLAGIPVDRCDGLSGPELTEIVTMVAGALDYLHGRGIVHGNVSLANIEIVRSSEGKTTRVALTGCEIGGNLAVVRGVQAGTHTAKRAYTAPEILNGDQLRPPSDQYALAAVTYQLLVGVPPFSAPPTPAGLMMAQVSEPPPRVAAIAPQFASVDPALQRAMAKNPMSRFASCGEFASVFGREFRQALVQPDPAIMNPAGPEPVPSQRYPAPSAVQAASFPSPTDSRHRKRNRLLVAAALSAVVLIIVASGVAALMIMLGERGNASDSESVAGPTRIADPPGVSAGSWTQVSTRFKVACGVASGEVYCWGDNSDGLLGNGTTTNSLTPVKVEGLAGATAVAVGRSSVCAIATGSTYCWGKAGFVGNASNTDSLTPVKVNGIEGASSISVYEHHACAVAGEYIYCWGALAEDGALGITRDDVSQADAASRGLPVRRWMSDTTQVSAGDGFTCVVSSRSAFCWGQPANGVLGDGVQATSSAGDPATLVTVRNVSGVTNISSGSSNSCAVGSGRVYCWGRGIDEGRDQPMPTEVSGLVGATQVSVGTGYRCAVASDAAYCWGEGGHGRLGNGSQDSLKTPTRVPGLGRVSEVAADRNYTCAVSDGSLFCWGDLVGD